jgi:hypothetical protein
MTTRSPQHPINNNTSHFHEHLCRPHAVSTIHLGIFTVAEKPVWALEASVLDHHVPRVRLPGVYVFIRL